MTSNGNGRRKTKIVHEGRTIEADEMEFDVAVEDWNEYACEDGSMIRVKNVVSRIFRTAETTETGEPLYVIISKNVLAVRPAPLEEENLGTVN